MDIVHEQLKKKHWPHYEATLSDQPEDVARMLRGLLFARNRITHEVDEVAYLLAMAKGLDGFAANWIWQSLPSRPSDRQGALHRDYEEVLVGRDVVDTLLTVTVFLGQARNRMWRSYGND